MIRTFVLLMLVMCALPAHACSCVEDGLTLEQRIDGADRVLLVRVVGAELVQEPAPPLASLSERRKGPGRVEYSVRVVEQMKGDAAPLPPIAGGAVVWSGGCNQRLALAEDVLMFVELETQEIQVSTCSTEVERLQPYPESEPRLQAIRDFVLTRKPVHDCENRHYTPGDMEAVCEARKAEDLAPYYRRLRESFRPSATLRDAAGGKPPAE